MPYSDNDYNLFPRYNALKAILHGAETIIDKKFSSINDCKNELKNIGLNSQTIFTVDEMDNDYETEILEINGCETVYTNIKFDWIIYISHEMYMAFGGKLLIGFLKELFSDRMDKINKYEW